MSYLLLPSTAFKRAAERCLRRTPELEDAIEAVLQLLSVNPFDRRLKTHKLTGELKGLWACTAGYDLRLVFQFVEFQGRQAILLRTIGGHEEVY